MESTSFARLERFYTVAWVLSFLLVLLTKLLWRIATPLRRGASISSPNS